MSRRRYYNKWSSYNSSVSCCHKRHCCCEENDVDVEVCTAVSPNDLRFPTQILAFKDTVGGGGFYSYYNTPQNVFNITEVAHSASQIDFYLQRDVGTDTFMYGTITDYTTTGIPNIYDPNSNPSSIGGEGYLERVGISPINDGTLSGEAVKFKLTRPPTGVWPPNFSITINFTAQEYNKTTACSISSSVQYFFVNENAIGTRSLMTAGAKNTGELPGGVVLDYNEVFDLLIKATSQVLPIIEYTVDPTPGISIQTVFDQGPNLAFNQNIDNVTGGTITFQVKDFNESFTLTEYAVYADNSILGTKTFNVTVQPPPPPRVGYTLPPALPNTSSSGSLRSSHMFYDNVSTQNPLYVVQSNSNADPPTIWVPFQWTKGSPLSFLPRIEIHSTFGSQPTYNDATMVTGVCVAPNGVTFPMWFSAAVNNSFIPNTSNVTALANWLDTNFTGGFQPMGFRFTNIPPWVTTKADSQKLIIQKNAFSNCYLGSYVFRTAQQLFNDNDNSLPVSTLFYQTTTSTEEAGALKLNVTGQGTTTFSITKTGIHVKSLVLYMQGGIVLVDSNGNGIDIFGCDAGVREWTLVRLIDYPAYDEDSGQLIYSFRKMDGVNGNVRGFSWYNGA